jgi:hypothetical protein
VVIAKRKGSVYEPGRRSGSWVKYKINQSQEFVIGGYTPGNPFDALIVGCYEGANLQFVASQRTGDDRVPLCQSTREAADDVGAYSRRNERMPLAEAGAGRSDRVHRMDA